MEIKQRVVKLLQRVGMSRSEAKFYFLVHRNPGLTLKELQKKSGVSRATVYRSFESLKNLGLLASSPENWRKNVTAVPLRMVADKLAKEQRQLKKAELELKSIDDLMGLTAFSGIENDIEIITNQNQIQEKYFEMLHMNPDHFLCYGSCERLFDIIGEAAEKEWLKTRVKMGKTVELHLTEVGEYASYMLPVNKQELRDVKISVDEKNQDQCTYIGRDMLCVLSKDEELGERNIIIRDPAIVKMQQRMFRSLWKST